jgi:DNA-binding transcriptional LysR family regulator
VEDRRASWRRLRRFEQVTGYHSINTVAATLGHHMQNLNLQIQRLEADPSAQLLLRGNRHQPITPTRPGQRLLDHLQRPDVRALLDQYAPPSAHQKRGPYKRRNATAT